MLLQKVRYQTVLLLVISYKILCVCSHNVIK